MKGSFPFLAVCLGQQTDIISFILLSLGIWYNILSGMGKFSVIINVSIKILKDLFNKSEIWVSSALKHTT